MTHRAFQQVDVFSALPYYGNALAVVLDGSGLSDLQMQRFAAWTQLAETTFILPPSAPAAAAGADYQVRIFTTAYEMPFAGHPTLGSCHAWLDHGGVPRDSHTMLQECKAGLVRIRRIDNRLAFAAPPLQRRSPDANTVNALASALGLHATQIHAAQFLNNGPRHFGLLLDQPASVLGLTPDPVALRAWMVAQAVSGVGMAALAGGSPSDPPGASPLIRRSNREARAFVGGGVIADTGTGAAPAQCEVRFFANDVALVEDPVTGSFNASLAQWLIAEGWAPPRYLAAQGTRIGRAGRVHIEQDDQGQVWVGGDCVTCLHGEVMI